MIPELQYTVITPNTKRNNAKPQPPKWGVGVRLGRCVVEQYLGRQVVDNRADSHNKTAHVYLLRCDCGNQFEVRQQALYNSMKKRKSDYSCGCTNQTNQYHQPEPVPSLHDWGYRVKPINPHLARRQANG